MLSCLGLSSAEDCLEEDDDDGDDDDEETGDDVLDELGRGEETLESDMLSSRPESLDDRVES